ncbi:hypothetical protein ABZ845_02475 [Streptomyces sp. NPDC047022]|uniref:hypothetical protein n=1 Tax=Streptomyces sp. NPDC047022 TaxID=3155737 RepID=UPI0033F7E583
MGSGQHVLIFQAGESGAMGWTKAGAGGGDADLDATVSPGNSSGVGNDNVSVPPTSTDCLRSSWLSSPASTERRERGVRR